MKLSLFAVANCGWSTGYWLTLAQDLVLWVNVLILIHDVLVVDGRHLLRHQRYVCFCGQETASVVNDFGKSAGFGTSSVNTFNICVLDITAVPAALRRPLLSSLSLASSTRAWNVLIIFLYSASTCFAPESVLDWRDEAYEQQKPRQCKKRPLDPSRHVSTRSSALAE